MRAKLWAKLSGSALRMKLMSPWRYSVTFFERCRATATKPMRSNSAASFSGSGAAYSMNSKPSVPMGFSKRSVRSEEHTSELQSLMRISYDVFCLKKKKKYHQTRYKPRYHNDNY